MRILILLLTAVFVIAVFGLMVMNASETVTVRVWTDASHEYRNIPLDVVLFLAAFAGFVFTGIIAVFEGMKTRLDNARLNRQVRKLQRELDAIRTPALPLPDDESAEGDEGEEIVEGSESPVGEPR